MRGADAQPGKLFSYVDMEDRIPESHPLRAIRKLTDSALAALSDDFDELYSRVGRPGIAPEKLLRALLLQVFFSIRSERQFMEHFSVDSMRILAWASVKSFRTKEEGGGDDGAGGCRDEVRDFRGERWSNKTHESTTDKDARLYRKLEAELSYLDHALMENRNGLVVDGLATRATGTAERDAVEVMLMRRPGREGIRGDLQGVQRLGPCGAEHLTSNRALEHTDRVGGVFGLQGESGGAQAGGGSVRLGKDGRGHGKDAAPGPGQQGGLAAYAFAVGL